MSRWGRGGMVGVHKAIWQNEQTNKHAARILADECDTSRTVEIKGEKVTFGHKLGERSDLCPKCKAHQDRLASIHSLPMGQPKDQ